MCSVAAANDSKSSRMEVDASASPPEKDKIEDRIKSENGARWITTPYKEKFLLLRQRYETVNSAHEEHTRALEQANAKMKRLQAENDLLLDAVGLLMAIDQQQLQAAQQAQAQSQMSHPYSQPPYPPPPPHPYSRSDNTSSISYPHSYSHPPHPQPVHHSPVQNFRLPPPANPNSNPHQINGHVPSQSQSRYYGNGNGPVDLSPEYGPQEMNGHRQ